MTTSEIGTAAHLYDDAQWAFEQHMLTCPFCPAGVACVGGVEVLAQESRAFDVWKAADPVEAAWSQLDRSMNL